MKLVIPGGSGHLGREARGHFEKLGWEVVVLSRTPTGTSDLAWDGRTLGPWAESIDGADVVLNLAGRSINCRYTPQHLAEIRDSRVDSTRVVGQAIEHAKRPPKLWLQASSLSLYAHRYDAANDESGAIASGEPVKWMAIVDIILAWEAALNAANTPHTRRIALRNSGVLQNTKGSLLDVLTGLAKKGLLGTLGDGKQFVSWIHIADFLGILQFCLKHEDLSGPINVCTPFPLPMKEFAKEVREALGVKIGLPAPAPLLEIGTFLMGTETELILKSRRCTPGKLLDSGFDFRFAKLEEALRDLIKGHR